VIKSAELAGPSCMTHAADDEPLFVLRANDELAPLIVRFWAREYAMKIDDKGDDYGRRLAKYRDALDIADAMERWHAKKRANAVIDSLGDGNG